ncbi:hypothetical protein [Natronobacterium gregoryi]|uniref:Uncharacterized protein n=2 Tax=Natronobacterium gregoryi TaxID=44930 RepID=L0AGR6_NATGS|nr:hypothetical protein [Natronobacterium gregoryi]AFZ73011.1 hypothetical protein Natgr_1820 [Natronobacterium gregoryi SP2]ELY64865.1 hypothetical protein C490_14305 [Natronobacterium gregoryi SP2]PLK18370.1 hypothetical protein CYV19_18025 [Natronobacterium gregoryi SP2]SFJ71535.1 hypothetical protein SAMN05443661_1644 [Natronobacterium gregoryi]
MPIPGYDADSIAEAVLERVGARVAVVADVVPDEFDLERSGIEPPADALSDPVSITCFEGLQAVEAVRLTLSYDPSELPPGASPTDVAVTARTDDGWESLESTTDLEKTTVTAVLNDRPPGSTIAAGYDDHAADELGR